ncbi:hypothetical protein JTE90_014665 [Oedothorax gibbosus]|uniref:Uncharacterized protein n=1 Tax=Oedothorax gibbosus TaxID=931172 RepID=A0AAV6V8E3_9ARAC|nr:hypothetical protein JTE90_014665 [Oedothorax gibbosus]
MINYFLTCQSKKSAQPENSKRWPLGCLWLLKRFKTQNEKKKEVDNCNYGQDLQRFLVSYKTSKHVWSPVQTPWIYYGFLWVQQLLMPAVKH